MDKKKCPQCKNLISISAPTCLYCGRPNKFVTKEYVNKKWNENRNERKFSFIFTSKPFIFIFIFLMIFFIIFFK